MRRHKAGRFGFVGRKGAGLGVKRLVVVVFNWQKAGWTAVDPVDLDDRPRYHLV